MTSNVENTVGGKAILWGSMGAEVLSVVYDLRHMILCAAALILADLWWGYSASKKRWWHAKSIGNETLMEKFKWHKSRAVRRTMNKMVDYVTFLVLGALIGVAITEPMEICSHIWTAALGLGIGCGCEVASIIGHVAYVKMDAEISMVDGWKAFMRFLGRLIRVKSDEIGGAVEDLGRERHHHRPPMDEGEVEEPYEPPYGRRTDLDRDDF